MSPRLRWVLDAALVTGIFVGAGIAAIVGGLALGTARLAPPDEFECLGAPSAAHRAVCSGGTRAPRWPGRRGAG